MIEQYIVEEVQNKSVIPYVFRVGTGEGEYATPELAEQAAKANYHSIMNSVYSFNHQYNGAILLHMYGKNPTVIEMQEIVERAGEG